MSDTGTLHQEVIETAHELQDAINAANSIAAETEAISVAPEFDTTAIEQLDPDDDDSVREARRMVKMQQPEYQDFKRELEYYQKPSGAVGPFPLDAIERTLARFTNYSPTWEVSDSAVATARLATDIDRLFDRLVADLTELEKAARLASDW